VWIRESLEELEEPWTFRFRWGAYLVVQADGVGMKLMNKRVARPISSRFTGNLQRRNSNAFNTQRH
jgi:hypothetical protein